MPKSIRLTNVDYIVTSDNKTIDLNNLYSSSLLADGHSADVSMAFFSYGEGGSIWQKRSFTDSTATAVGFGAYSQDRIHVGGCSSGSKAMIAGGQTSTTVNTTDILNYSDETSSQWGSLDMSPTARAQGAAANTSLAMFAGGDWWSGGSVWYNQVKVHSFETNATASDYGTLGTPNGPAGASDGTYAYFMGGGNGVSVEVRKFGDSSYSVPHGSMLGSNGNPVAGSNGKEAMFQSMTHGVQRMSFASNTTSTPHSSLSHDVHGAAAASGPSSCMFACGWTTSKQNFVDMVSYDDGATAQSFGWLVAPNYGLKGGSGNA